MRLRVLFELEPAHVAVIAHANTRLIFELSVPDNGAAGGTSPRHVPRMDIKTCAASVSSRSQFSAWRH